MGTRAKNIASLPEFRGKKSCSPEEIWAAGGTTAFGKKAGQSNKKLVEALKSSPEIEPFTEEEWNQTLIHLKESK